MIMKRIIFFIIIFISYISKAQVTSSNSSAFKSIIVKDSSGTIYSYDNWNAQLKTGEYSLRNLDPNDKSQGYIIYKLTEQEKHKRDSVAKTYANHAIKNSESNFFTTGKKIDPFKEKDMDRNKLSIEDMKGKVIVLNFWFVGCPPCRAEIPELNNIVEKYKDNPNIVFIGIALDDYVTIKNFLATNPFKYHIIENGRYIAQGKYGINVYPTNVVVDKQGIVRFHSSGVGFTTIRGIKKTIEDLINEN